MANIMNSIYEINTLDDLAKKDTIIHCIHPLVKLITTFLYLICVVSFNKYEISGLIPFVFYPILITSLGEIPLTPILKRVLIAAPFILGVGVINLFYDKTPMNVAGIIINSGWITFLSLSIKILLTVVVSILLIATTGMENLACALRMIKVPKIFVMQILLTYRYISVLVEEASRMMKAYYLRAPGQKGVKMKDLGSFIGQMLLRTYDRAQRVYEAMKLRGFNGEYNSTASLKIKLSDYLYLTIWCLFFIVARNFNIPILIGNLFSGVIG